MYLSTFLTVCKGHQRYPAARLGIHRCTKEGLVQHVLDVDERWIEGKWPAIKGDRRDDVEALDEDANGLLREGRPRPTSCSRFIPFTTLQIDGLQVDEQVREVRVRERGRRDSARPRVLLQGRELSCPSRTRALDCISNL